MCTFLTCDTCQRRFQPGEVELTCPDCGPWLGTRTVDYDFDQLRSVFLRAQLKASVEQSLWRYLPVLPVSRKPASLHPRAGWTPIYSIERLQKHLGIRELLVKDDGLNPSASLKDRASAVAVADAIARGRTVVSAASTGNAASSLSLFAACAGLRAVIFVPERAPEAKLTQLLCFGADVLAVRGTYDQAFDLCLEVSAEQGWYCRNTAVNPVLSEGKKTAALEIVEQLDFEPPDAVIVGAGDGCILGGLWKGFEDARRLGWTTRAPRLFGVQAEGAAPLAHAFARGDAIATPEPARTVADSICVGTPRDHIKALRAARASGGAIVAVPDSEILAAIGLLAREGGVFAEPAGAAPLAGLLSLRARGLIAPSERVLLLVTGNGLKDTASARQSVDRRPVPIDADRAAVAAWLKEAGI